MRPRTSLSAQRRVGGGLKVVVHPRERGGLEHALRQHDDDHVGSRIHEPRGAEPAVPAIRAAVINGLAEAPRTVAEEVRAKTPVWAFWAPVSWSLVMARTASGGRTGYLTAAASG